MTNWNSIFATRAHRIQASEIRELTAIGKAPGFISLAGGSPAAQGFPFNEARDITDEILRDEVSRITAMQYGISDGYPPLREFISSYVVGAFAPLSIENVVITSGAQQSLDFLGKILLNSGDRVLTTFPTFPGMLQALNVYDPVYVDVGTDTGVVDLEKLERECIVGGKMLYLMPDYCNPTGLTMSAGLRQQIIAIAKRNNIVVVEDHPYDELRYEGERLAPMLAYDSLQDYDQSGSIIYLGTFSKSLAPGLRIGWMIAPAEFARKAVLMKQASDIMSGSLNQMIAHRLGPLLYTDYLEQLRGHYRKRRVAMLQTLEEQMPAEVSWSKPTGGFFLWVELPNRLDGNELLQTAIRDEKLTFVPGVAFYNDKKPRSSLRLSFSGAPPDQIQEGILRLSRAMKSML